MSNNANSDPLASPAEFYPLQPEDPVKVGDFWLDARLTASPAGMGFVAHEDGGDPVMLVLLSEGAAADAAARSRFSGEINRMHIDTVVARGGQNQDEGLLAVKFRNGDSVPKTPEMPQLAPWAALAFDGTVRAVTEADRILHEVDLLLTPPLGTPHGPGFRMHWLDKTKLGVFRTWPLPWPGRKDRAGWITMLVSWLLMILLTALAVLLAILVFQNQPLVSPPPPIPSENSGGGSGEETTSQGPSGDETYGEGGSSGEETASPEASGTESNGNGGNPSDNPSMMEPSGDESGPGDPSPNHRL